MRYCNAACQKLHWSSHKNFCKELRLQYEAQLRQQKLEKEREEQAKKKQEADENNEKEVDENIEPNQENVEQPDEQIVTGDMKECTLKDESNADVAVDS